MSGQSEKFRKYPKGKIIIGFIVLAVVAIPLKLESEISNRRAYIEWQRDIKWLPDLTRAFRIMHITNMPGMVGLLADRDKVQEMLDAASSSEDEKFDKLHFTRYLSGAQCVSDAHQEKMKLLKEYSGLLEDRTTDEAHIHHLLNSVKRYTGVLDRCRDFGIGQADN